MRIFNRFFRGIIKIWFEPKTNQIFLNYLNKSDYLDLIDFVAVKKDDITNNCNAIMSNIYDTKSNDYT